MYIDSLAYASPLRRVYPAFKGASALAALLLCLFVNRMAFSLLVLLAASVATVWAGGAPLRQYARLLRVPFVFLLMSSVGIALQFGSAPLAINLLHIGRLYIGTTPASLLLCVQLLLKAMGCSSSLFFLMLTTPMVDVIFLLQKLRVSAVVIDLMLLMYRFLFVLSGQAEDIHRSQQARMGYHGMRRGLRSMAELLGALFVLSFRRADALYTSMEARLYTGELRLLAEQYEAKPVVVAAFGGATFALLAAGILAGGWL